MLFCPANSFAKAADYARTAHHVVTEGATLEDIARPSWWTHVAPRLRAMDVVDVVDKGGAFDVTVRVLEVGIFGARTRLLRIWRNEDVVVSQDEGKIETELRIAEGLVIKRQPGRLEKYRVIRDADSMELVAGLSKADAERWVEEHRDVA